MIDKSSKKLQGRLRRQKRIRAKVSGTAARPRLAVFRSAKNIYAQLIDDTTGKTLVAARNTEMTAKDIKELAGERNAKVAASFAVGMKIAEKAKAANIAKVVFDRGGRAYTGRVAALAEGAREGGLEF